MTMIKNIFITLTSVCILYACIGTDVSESKADISTDVAEITVQAEFLADGDNVKTVVIRSNRSWFAHLDDMDHPVDPGDPGARVNWATLSIERHQNLTNTIDETEIVITFNENYSPASINGILNIWCEGEIMKAIPILQTGRVYHISARTDIENAKCDSDVVSVSVESNTKWTARVSENSTADVQLETAYGNGPGTLNVIFGENFSQTENKTAEIIFSARGCDDYVLTISQSRAVPYVYVLPEYDGKVLGGESKATLKIRSNADWSAEVVESELDNFTIVNPHGQNGTSEPQEVNVTFNPNDSGNPYTVRTAKIRFVADGMDEPVVYEFRQRGCLVVTFEELSAFSPEIPNTLVSASGQPSNMSRPGKINTDVDIFKFTSSAKYPDKDEYISVDLEMSQYIRYDTPKNALYVIGAGKVPYVKFTGLEGLKISKLSVGCVAEGWFSGNIVEDTHVLTNGQKTTVEYTGIIDQGSWTAPSDGQYYYLDFDLSEKGVAIDEGRGCTLRTSTENNAATKDAKVTKMYIKTVTFIYL